MKKKYITIEREYGSGGTEIARQLSEQTGIPCYGREILEEVAKKGNIPVEQIQAYEETVTNSILYSIYLMSKAASGSADLLTDDGKIYVAEQTVIRSFADQGPAVFLGHCACEALKEKEGVLNVFIRCSDGDAKRKRIEETYGIPEDQVSAVRRKFDKKRANYYYANTGKRWDDLKNYDLTLDSGVIGIDGCVDVLKELCQPVKSYEKNR